MRPELAIFDLDGTILDTLGDLTAALNHALTAHGFPPRTPEEARSFVGNGIRNLIRRALPAGTPEETVEAVHADFGPFYHDRCAVHTRPYAGIPEALAALRAAGVRTAVVSNKPDREARLLVEAYFPGLFDAAAGEKPGVPRKPAPDGVAAVLRALRADPARAVYIGDSEVDVETARNAGLRCVSVDWGFRTRAQLEAAGAAEIVSAPEALRRTLGVE